jgi:hypothetical protein
MQEVDEHESSTQLSGRRRRRKRLYFTTKRVRERASNMRKKSNRVVQKFTEDVAESEKSIDLNDLDEEDEEAREEVDGDVYNNTAKQIGTCEDVEEEGEENDSSHESEEYGTGDEIYSVSIHILFIIG